LWSAKQGISCSTKTVAEWFPKKERALTTGIYNSGANIEQCLRRLSFMVNCNVWMAGSIYHRSALWDLSGSFSGGAL